MAGITSKSASGTWVNLSYFLFPADNSYFLFFSLKFWKAFCSLSHTFNSYFSFLPAGYKDVFYIYRLSYLFRNTGKSFYMLKVRNRKGLLKYSYPHFISNTNFIQRNRMPLCEPLRPEKDSRDKRTKGLLMCLNFAKK